MRECERFDASAGLSDALHDDSGERANRACLRGTASSQEFCRTVQTLQQLEPVVADKTGGSGLEACARAVEQHLTKGIYTHDEVRCLATRRCSRGAPRLDR